MDEMTMSWEAEHLGAEKLLLDLINGLQISTHQYLSNYSSYTDMIPLVESHNLSRS